QVLRQAVQRCPSPYFASVFLDPSGIAEGARRSVASFFPSAARFLLLFCFQFQGIPELPFQGPIPALPGSPRPPGDDSLPQVHFSSPQPAPSRGQWRQPVVSTSNPVSSDVSSRPA